MLLKEVFVEPNVLPGVTNKCVTWSYKQVCYLELQTSAFLYTSVPYTYPSTNVHSFLIIIIII